MTQELKQRIIGAIVVTALAAIFVPMLFDDPIDDSGQSVSELAIPENQVDVVEEESPLPSRAEDIIKVPDEAGQGGANGDSAGKNAAALSDMQAAADGGLEPDELPREDEEGFGDEEPINSQLDTGEVEETRRPAPTKPVVAAAPKVKSTPTVKKPVSDNLVAKSKPAPVTQLADTPEIKPSTKKSVASGQRWSIQAGSFSKKENALAMMDTLKKQGIPVTIVNRDSLYRLKVGSGLDKKHALAMKAKLDQLNVQNMLLPE